MTELEKKYEAYKILNGEIMHHKNRIAGLESEILSLRQDKAIIDNYVKELEAQVENMKCCGNCGYWKRIGCRGVEPEHCCRNWKPG